ncbi:MAG: 4Fe-4S dicluster domain-containing protein [Promethearchaeota archaeon]
MKWPIVSQTIKGSVRTTTVEYLKKTLNLEFDSDKCKFCQQCVKACPHQVLEKGVFDKKSPTMKFDRLPQMPDPTKCVFCGTCFYICPFEAISFKIDRIPQKKEELPLVRRKVLPIFQELKVGKVILSDPSFSSPYWESLACRILRQSKKSSSTTE